MITVFPNLLTFSQQAEVEESKDDNKENEDKNHEDDEAEEDGDDEKEDEEEKVSLISGHFERILRQNYHLYLFNKCELLVPSPF